MNAYEVQQIEKQMKAEFNLPLSYVGWAEIERRARAERARMMTRAVKDFFAAVSAKLQGVSGQVRRTAAECTDARLKHS
jgi:hypothetical protein